MPNLVAQKTTRGKSGRSTSMPRDMVRHGHLDESVISNNTVKRDEDESRDDKSVRSIPQKVVVETPEVQTKNDEQTPPRNRGAMDLRKKPIVPGVKRGPGQPSFPGRPGGIPSTVKKENEPKESETSSPVETMPTMDEPKADNTEQARLTKVLRSNPFARKTPNADDKKETTESPPQNEEQQQEDIKTPPKEISTHQETPVEEPEEPPKEEELTKKLPPGPVFKLGPPKANPPRMQPGIRPPGARPTGSGGAPKRPPPPV